MQMKRGQSESFYSMYSHQSLFQQFSPDKNNFLQEEFPPNTEIKMVKIAQSNFNLDDGVMDPSQDGQSASRKSFETVRPYQSQNQKQQIGKQKIISTITEHHEQFLEANDISDIHPNQINQVLDQSVCLMRQIDCLSTDQVNHEQLRQIKKKIQLLKNQQLSMQNSLNLANQMLKNAKTRNKTLQEQIANCRKTQQLRNQSQPYQKLTELKQAHISREHRYFPQHSSAQNNQQLARLKVIYKECSLKESFCIYQNEGYKIEVFYEREKHVSDPKMVIISVKLTPHHHIMSRKQFKFGIQFDKNTKVNPKDLTYEAVIKNQQFVAWPESKFHLQAYIHEYDESSNNHHTHIVLVPLPITHFFEPRMTFMQQNSRKRIKCSLSQYSLTFDGAIALNWIQKVKQMWWDGKFISCLGWNQLILFQINLEEDKNLKIQLFGKKNGKILTGIIQYLSFFLTS